MLKERQQASETVDLEMNIGKIKIVSSIQEHLRIGKETIETMTTTSIWDK